jgi:hypothetical protein
VFGTNLSLKLRANVIFLCQESAKLLIYIYEIGTAELLFLGEVSEYANVEAIISVGEVNDSPLERVEFGIYITTSLKIGDSGY